MSLNDELEKIRQAEEWLSTESPGSQLYAAARDHLLSVADWSPDHAIRNAARAAIHRWLGDIGDLHLPLRPL